MSLNIEKGWGAKNPYCQCKECVTLDYPSQQPFEHYCAKMVSKWEILEVKRSAVTLQQNISNTI